MDSISKLVIQILITPGIMISIINIIALGIQKKEIKIIINNTIKLLIGYVMMMVGVYLIYMVLNQLDLLLRNSLMINESLVDNKYVLDLALSSYLYLVALVMIFGYILSGVLAYFSRFKYFTIMLYQLLPLSAIIVLILDLCKLNYIIIVGVGACILAMILTILPMTMHNATKRSVERLEFTTFDLNSCIHGVGLLIAKPIHKYLIKDQRSIEDITLKHPFDILNDYNISYTVVIFIISILYYLIGICLNYSYLQNISPTFHWVVNLFVQCGMFPLAFNLIILGVNIMIDEIYDCLNAIKEIIPNLHIALDSIILYPFAPKITLLGFVCAIGGYIIGMILVALLQLIHAPVVLLLPSLSSLFFLGSITIILMERSYGYKTGIFVTVISTIIYTLVISYSTHLLAGLSFTNSNLFSFDLSIVLIILGNANLYINPVGIVSVVVMLYILPIGHEQLRLYLEKKNNLSIRKIDMNTDMENKEEL